MSLRHSEQGVVLLLSVLIMAAVGLSVFLAVSQIAINSIAAGREEESAWIVRSSVFGCLEEALIQMAGDPTFSDPTVTTNQATCNVAYQVPQAGTTDVLVTLASSGISRGVRARVTLTPIIVSEVEETLTF